LIDDEGGANYQDSIGLARVRATKLLHLVGQ